MNKAHKVSNGFTLVELLVVIAIMAVLISILVPALTQAKYQAMRTQCLANVKAQHMAQFMYATDNEGRFARHVDAGPDFVRSYSQPKDQCIYGRLKDSEYMGNSQIMLCPILASRLSWFIGTGADKSRLTPFRSLEDINDNGDGYYANWNYEQDPDYDPSQDYGLKPLNNYSGLYGYVTIAYMWFANYEPINTALKVSFDFEYDGMPVHTTPWPRNLREAREDAAMITHVVKGNSSFFQDYSHKGAGFSYDIAGFENFSETADNPVGFGDGHVDMVPRPDVEPRALEGGTSYFYY